MSGIAPTRIWLAAALLMPLAVLAYGWATTHRLAQQGQEWLIPVSGYDPRDLLRGHYVQYRYDWPLDRSSTDSPNGEAAPFHPSIVNPLCIEGTPPNIVRVRELSVVGGQADPARAKGCAIVARASMGTRREVRGLESGILFTSQSRALALSRQLASPDKKGFVRVKIRPDGVMRPIDLELRPRKGN